MGHDGLWSALWALVCAVGPVRLVCGGLLGLTIFGRSHLAMWPLLVFGWLAFGYAWGWKGFYECADGPKAWARILTCILVMHLLLLGVVGYSYGWSGVGWALWNGAIIVGMFAPFSFGSELVNDLWGWWRRARQA